MTKPSKHTAVIRLSRSLDRIEELKSYSINSPQFTKWRRDTEIAIENVFGDEKIEDFKKIRFTPMSYIPGHPDLQLQMHIHYKRGLDNASAIIESMVDEVNEYWEDEPDVGFNNEIKVDRKSDTNEVFIVHGHDDGVKQAVARFLEQLELSPTILHEQPNLGRTLIEKFEQHAQTTFAVILLTPDDVGKTKEGDEELKPRARQNVILELGYFLGVLGRERVCPLVTEGVEIPSDYDGVAYVPLDDSGGWRLELIRELKAAGFDVDANRAL